MHNFTCPASIKLANKTQSSVLQILSCCEYARRVRALQTAPTVWLFSPELSVHWLTHDKLWVGVFFWWTQPSSAFKFLSHVMDHQLPGSRGDWSLWHRFSKEDLRMKNGKLKEEKGNHFCKLIFNNSILIILMFFVTVYILSILRNNTIHNHNGWSFQISSSF